MNAELMVLSGTSYPDLARRICRRLGVQPGDSQVITFSNENLMARIRDNVRERDVFLIQTHASPVNDKIMEMLLMLDALKYASAARITAVLPYFPYGRSDKKDEPRISIAARLMADLIETAGAHRVLTMDLHAPQIQGFFRIPADQLLAAPVFFEYFKRHLFSEHPKEEFVLVMADHGASKRFNYFFDELDIPVAIVDKVRIGHTETTKVKRVIGEVRGKYALLVDDEIASGGTVIKAVEHLIEKEGVKGVYVSVIHPILSGKAVERLMKAPIERVIVANTVPVAHKLPEATARDREMECKNHLASDCIVDMVRGKFVVLDVSSLFAEAIRCIHDGESLSSLFPPSLRRFKNV